MGYLKLASSDIRPAKVSALPRAEDVALRARRLAPAPANGKQHLPGADQLALAQIAQRFAPGAQPAVPQEDQRFESRPQAPRMQSPSLTASPRGMRTLIGVLILVALLPSALFGAMVWLGAIHITWPAPWLKTQEPAWTAAAPASVTGALAVEQPQPKPVKTLTIMPPFQEKPETTRTASTELAPEVTKEPEITGSIAAVEDGAQAPAPELAYDTNLIGVVSWDHERHALLGATGVEEVFTEPDEAAPPPEHLMRAPDVDDDGKNWITPSQFVNLRKGPTSSAAVLGVVAKGAKLEVMGRKRGWVQVANPATSKTGWIYAGSKARRKAKPAGEETAEGGSFWGNLFSSSD